VAARTRAELLAAFVEARVFAAVGASATSERVTESGVRAAATADMAVVLVEAGGERALPVFTTPAELTRWQPSARPVPLTGSEAARAALDEGAGTLLLDPAGRTVEISADELRALAAGFVPVPGADVASRRAEVALGAPRAPVSADLLSALRSALAPERLVGARLLEGPDGLVVGVVAREPLAPAELAALGQRVAARLGAALPADGLDLAQVPRRGAGVPLLGRNWLRPAR
jgi:hypothetical protein